jgi:alpha-methylacyl-CoA racemase
MDAPLAGIRVVDLSRLLPGPYCTMLLADLGAEVLKVEAPGIGDYARTIMAEFGGPPLFDAVNRNKKGVAVNYRHPAGREVLLRLAARADIFVETFRPGAAARWGIDYAALSANNPRIVYCSLSGYGQTGPYAGRAGHDLNFAAVGGLLALNGAAGGPPIPPGVQVADLAGGMLAAVAILAALRGRDQTGHGAYLDVSMLDAMVSWVGHLATCSYQPCDDVSTVTRGSTPLAGTLPCYNVYRTADDRYLALCAVEPHFWEAFCKTMERADLLDRRLDPGAIPVLKELFGRRSRAEWLALFEDVDACVEPVNELDEVLGHPQVRHRCLVDDEGRVTSPFRRTGRASAPAPALGEHTHAVLCELGLLEDEIAALEQAGSVG